jgi:hypothetical protein
VIIIKQLVNSKNPVRLTLPDIIPIICNFEEPASFGWPFCLRDGNPKWIVVTPESLKRFICIEIYPHTSWDSRAGLPILVMTGSLPHHPVLRAISLGFAAIARL